MAHPVNRIPAGRREMNWDGRGDVHDYLSFTNFHNPIREEERRPRVRRRHLDRRATTLELHVRMEAFGQTPPLAGGD